MKNLVCSGALLLAVAGALLWAQPTPEELSTVMTTDGKKLYGDYCASCHGANGRGNGPVAASLKTPPPDLTRIASRNGGTFPTERVIETIAGAANSKSSHGSREMPIWGPVFSVAEWDMDFVQVRLENLAAYLKSLQR